MSSRSHVQSHATRRAIPTGEYERFRAGDPAYMQRLYATYDARLTACALRYFRDRDEAEDAVAETWRIAWERRESFRGMAPVHQWLLKVCTAVCVDRLRCRRKEEALLRTTVPYLEEFYVDEAVSELSALQFQAAVDRVTDAVSHLPPRQLQVVVLRYLLNKSTAETAESMQCAPGTVKASLHKAIQQLSKRSGNALSSLLAARAIRAAGTRDD